mmetsp:Transcript_25483/g.37601  ORF Transcript_25483/g.37601 Transcript_25483/m.37601 type:complete len:439 (+) Transcript_25483:44-1360(+)
MATDELTAVSLFVRLLQFETVSDTGPTNGGYKSCAEWLCSQCTEAGLTSFVLPESVENKPIVVAEWKGIDDSLPCVFLNGHYDVVPVVESQWQYPAFAGYRENGRIYGRGSQDMKCVCIQYLIALKRLKQRGYIPTRTIRLSFVPDEEIGGIDGMGVLLNSSWFLERPIGIALDEGLASESDEYSVFYGERLPWWIRITAEGNTGHASRFIEGTAMEQMMGVANRALEFRRKQKELLHGSCPHSGCSHSVAQSKTLGDVTSLNITKLHTNSDGSAEAFNVVPSTVQAGMDIRISPHVDPGDMALEIDRWCKEAEEAVPGGKGIKWEFDVNRGQQHATTATDESNPWWEVFTRCLSEQCGVQCKPMVFPAATDSRFLRALGIKAFGFSPIRRSPILLHEHNEYLAEDVFLEGCEVYCHVITALSSQAELQEDTCTNTSK